MPVQKNYMCAKDAALYVDLHLSTLAKFRMTGDGPEFQKAGRKVLYSQAALNTWLQSRTYSSTSQYIHKNSHKP